MKEYHKIYNLYVRDQNREFTEGLWAVPEFEYLKDCQWVWDEKIDGTNIRIGIDEEDKFFIKGRTDKAIIPPYLMEALQALDLEPKLRAVFGHAVCLYGEGYGCKIQKVGKLYRPDTHSFCLFDIKIGHFWLLRSAIEENAQTLGLEVSPQVGEGTLSEAIDFVKSKPMSTWGPFVMEGVIARPKVQLCTRIGARIITKIKVNDFVKTEG